MSTTSRTSPDSAMTEEPWKTPVEAKSLTETTSSPPPSGRDLDILTSSDEDEYLAAFSSKPISKKAPVKSPPTGPSRRGGVHGGALGRGKLRESAHGLPDRDVDGNPHTGCFCPLALVAKFPYKYMVDTNDRVSRHFFAQNKFYQREWDIYYLDPPESMTAKPLILLPLDQVKHLIDEINLAFKTDVECPPDPFTLSFFDDGTPQPKRIGTSRSREDLVQMEANIRRTSSDYAEVSLHQEGARNHAERSFADFKAKMERVLASTKKNKQAGKKKKKDDRLLRQQDWAKQLKRAQCYLGLRPTATEVTVTDTASSRAEQQKRHDQDLLGCGVLLDPLDTSKPAPYPFENEPIIVCVDVEAYERDHRMITEVGVSTLDTMDLAGKPPGEGGENWIAHIRSRHFRIRGREHLENKDFCPSHANNFHFGKSEWVNLDAAAEAVDQCFEHPYSAQFKQGNGKDHDKPTAVIPTKRNVIFLGHDIRNEFEYLKQLRSKIFNASRATDPMAIMGIDAREGRRSEMPSSIIEALDTAVLYKTLVKETQSRSLGKIMLGLGRTAWHLHNAGNDARYTLEALIALLIKARQLEDEAKDKGRIVQIENDNSVEAEATPKSWMNEVGGLRPRDITRWGAGHQRPV